MKAVLFLTMMTLVSSAQAVTLKCILFGGKQGQPSERRVEIIQVNSDARVVAKIGNLKVVMREERAYENRLTLRLMGDGVSFSTSTDSNTISASTGYRVTEDKNADVGSYGISCEENK